MFEKYFDNKHHTSVTFETEDCVCSIGVDFVNDIRSFPFRFKLAFGLVSKDHRSLYKENQVPFLKSPVSRFFYQKIQPCWLGRVQRFVRLLASFHRDFQDLAASTQHFFAIATLSDGS